MLWEMRRDELRGEAPIFEGNIRLEGFVREGKEDNDEADDTGGVSTRARSHGRNVPRERGASCTDQERNIWKLEWTLRHEE